MGGKNDCCWSFGRLFFVSLFKSIKPRLIHRGFLDLVGIFGGFLGDTQLKSLCMISSLALLISVGITSAAVTERIQLARFGEKKKGFFSRLFGVVMTLYQAVLTLPYRIGLIFCVQICSWYGWFLFLFYSSTWVGEVYTKYSLVPDADIEGHDQVGDIARIGSLSLTIFSTVSLICSLVLPEILRRVNPSQEGESWSPSGVEFLTRLPGISLYRKVRKGVRFVLGPFQDRLKKVANGQSFLGTIDLPLFWLLSQILYAFASFSMIYVRSVGQASVVVGIFGICWAVTTWAPFSMLAEEVLLMGHAEEQRLNKYPAQRDTSGQQALFMRGSRAQDIEMIAYDEPSTPRLSMDPPAESAQITQARNSFHGRKASVGTIELHIAQPVIDDNDQLSPKRKKPYITNSSLAFDIDASSIPPTSPTMIAGSSSSGRVVSSHARNISLTEDDFYSDGTEVNSTTGEHSGVYLGLHNVAITVPQLVSTFVSFLIFSVLEQPVEGSTEGLTESSKGDGGFAIAATMQLGGVAALASIYFIIKLRRDSRFSMA